MGDAALGVGVNMYNHDATTVYRHFADLMTDDQGTLPCTLVHSLIHLANARGHSMGAALLLQQPVQHTLEEMNQPISGSRSCKA